jgi:hypothetical protein
VNSLFDEGDVVASGRVQLSASDAGHLRAMSWLEQALAPEWTRDEVQACVDAGRGVLISDSAGLPMGLAVVLLDTPIKGGASIPFLGIDPARRFRGLGGEAGLAIEQHLRRRLHLERFYAPVPDGRGLAVYFWLRLGYRPLLLPDDSLPLAGLSAEPVRGIWMARDTP